MSRITLKLKLILIFAVLSALPVSGEDIKDEQDKTTGRFYIAFMRQDQDEEKLIPVTGSVIKKEFFNNILWFYFKPITNAYIYTFATISGKAFKKIELVPFSYFKKNNYRFTPYFITSSDNSWPRPEEGCWEIHCLISTKRLKDIEKIISRLDGISDKENSEKMRNGLYLLENKIEQLKAEKILDSRPLSVPQPFTGTPFRTDSEIKEFIENETVLENFTIIHYTKFTYECEKTN